MEKDFRFTANIVSSAITNKPPPAAVANLLARRNKIHHLDDETDETLLELFDKQPGEGEGVKPKSAPNNHATMPSRNYAIIAESHSHSPSPAATATAAPTTNGQPLTNGNHAATAPFAPASNPRSALHKGEEGAGASHAAAQGIQKTGLAGRFGLDVAVRVEVDSADTEGRTCGYGLSIPALEC